LNRFNIDRQYVTLYTPFSKTEHLSKINSKKEIAMIKSHNLMNSHIRILICPFILYITLALSSCGGGGGGDDKPIVNPPVTPLTGWQPGVFEDSNDFINLCESPRTGIDAAGYPVPDMQGSREDEKNFLRSWSNETYLWYDEIIDRNPAGSHTVLEYFNLLVTNETTETGRPKDIYHFAYPTDEWIRLSQSGIYAGYGANFITIRRSIPREVLVAYVEQGSPAELAGMHRGDSIIEVDGVSVEFGTDTETLNSGLFPAKTGDSHNFIIRDISGNTVSITMTSALITSDPVPVVETVNTETGNVGYLLFNDHIATAEEGLYDAVNELKSNNITDLILDLRYNTGGYLNIASQLAYMIGGSRISNLAVFENMLFNNKSTITNPVTGLPLRPTPFIDRTLGYDALPAGWPLPRLNLPRVFIITGSNTCSASESIINGLRGAGIEVIQIGSKTCGKPYGFYPQDNCGTTYFTIQYKAVNAQGFGDYPDGFSPSNAGGLGVKVPGCSVADDYEHSLGDTDELRFASALNYRANGSCPEPSGFAPGITLKAIESLKTETDGIINKSIALKNRVMVE
jgi:hypothetical protein